MTNKLQAEALAYFASSYNINKITEGEKNKSNTSKLNNSNSNNGNYSII